MINAKYILIIVVIFKSINVCMAQDSTHRNWLIPTSLITAGVVGTYQSDVNSIGMRVNDYVDQNYPNTTHADDYLQYLPAATTLGLSLAGVEGRNNLKEQTKTLIVATGIMGVTTLAVKNITKIQRPDRSAYNSFHSGHTALAFSGAEFLRMEYKDVSPWIGVAGYTAATAVGALRVYNDRHWVNDVVTGAGVGILSTQAAYLVMPIINKHFFKKSNEESSVKIMPFSMHESNGIYLSYTF
jgi:hypothetical protein